MYQFGFGQTVSIGTPTTYGTSYDVAITLSSPTALNDWELKIVQTNGTVNGISSIQVAGATLPASNYTVTGNEIVLNKNGFGWGAIAAGGNTVVTCRILSAEASPVVDWVYFPTAGSTNGGGSGSDIDPGEIWTTNEVDLVSLNTDATHLEIGTDVKKTLVDIIGKTDIRGDLWVYDENINSNTQGDPGTMFKVCNEVGVFSYLPTTLSPDLSAAGGSDYGLKITNSGGWGPTKYSILAESKYPYTLNDGWAGYFKGKTEVEGDLLVSKGDESTLFLHDPATDDFCFVREKEGVPNDYEWEQALKFKKDGSLVKRMNEDNAIAFAVDRFGNGNVFEIKGNGDFWTSQSAAIGADNHQDVQLRVKGSKQVGFCVEQDYYSTDSDGYGIKTIVAHDNVKAVGVYSNTAQEDVFKVMGDGKVWATEIEVHVLPFPDYVFEKNYDLKELKEVEHFIKKNEHLPNMPSAKDVEKNGIGLGELTRLQQEKIEELTLYIIELEKRMSKLERSIK